MSNPNLAAPPDSTAPAVPAAATTILTNLNGPLTKSASLAPDGSLKITPSAQLSEGTFDVRPAGTVTDLACIISQLKPNQAIAHGRPRSGALSGTVVSAAKLPANPGAIARSKECFAWNNGPGWLMLDVDAKDFPPELAARLDLSSLESIRAVLIGAAPELRDVPMLGLPSASAMIYRASEDDLI